VLEESFLGYNGHMGFQEPEVETKGSALMKEGRENFKEFEVNR
jgi:hypothetical protein